MEREALKQFDHAQNDDWYKNADNTDTVGNLGTHEGKNQNEPGNEQNKEKIDPKIKMLHRQNSVDNKVTRDMLRDYKQKEKEEVRNEDEKEAELQAQKECFDKKIRPEMWELEEHSYKVIGGTNTNNDKIYEMLTERSGKLENIMREDPWILDYCKENLFQGMRGYSSYQDMRVLVGEKGQEKPRDLRKGEHPLLAHPLYQNHGEYIEMVRDPLKGVSLGDAMKKWGEANNKTGGEVRAEVEELLGQHRLIDRQQSGAFPPKDRG